MIHMHVHTFDLEHLNRIITIYAIYRSIYYDMIRYDHLVTHPLCPGIQCRIYFVNFDYLAHEYPFVPKYLRND